MGGLDHIRRPQPPLATAWLSGNYYLLSTAPANSSTSNTLGVGILRATPFYVPNTVSITKVGSEITGAGEAGSKLRLGIYTHDLSTGLPGALLVDAGQIAGDSATVQEITLGSAVTMVSGWYWAVGVVQSVVTTQPTARTFNVATVPITLGTATPSAAAVSIGVARGSVTGALPSTFGTPDQGSVGSSPRVFVKT